MFQLYLRKWAKARFLGEGSIFNVYFLQYKQDYFSSQGLTFYTFIEREVDNKQLILLISKRDSLNRRFKCPKVYKIFIQRTCKVFELQKIEKAYWNITVQDFYLQMLGFNLKRLCKFYLLLISNKYFKFQFVKKIMKAK